MATENLAIGSDKKPVCVDKSGKIVPLTGNAGSVVADNLQPIYLLNGELVALTGTSGAYNKPVRVENGVIKPITVTAGNGGDRLIYFDNGGVNNSSKTVGDTNKPVYLKNGVVTPISGNIGSSVQPVFISNGVITGASGNTGSDTKPLKMSGGKLTPVTKDLATVEYVESALKSNAAYADFIKWNVQALSFIDKGSNVYDVNIPRDGYVTLAMVGNRVSQNYIYVIGKNNVEYCVNSCIGTDYWDNINRIVSNSFSCFIKAGNTIRIRGGLANSSWCYLFYP